MPRVTPELGCVGAGFGGDFALLSLAVTSVPRWEPDGTESPAERTDPLLPIITDDMLPPLDLPRLPTLDDQSLAQLLAELDGEEPGLVGDPETAPAAEPMAPAAEPSPTPVEPSVERAVELSVERAVEPSVERAPTPAERPLRLVEHPTSSRTHSSAAAGQVPSKYVRREYRPPVVPADALTLTGLTRRSRSRVGSILFKVAVVGIFLLILVQTIVSLLTPGT